MVQPPIIRLLVQFPILQLRQVPCLPLLRLRQPFLPPFVADGIDIDRVVVARVGREETVVPVWRVDRGSALRHHRKGETAELLTNSVTLA